MKLLTVKKQIAIGLMTLFTVSIASQSQAFLLGLLAGPNPIWGFINNVNIYKGHMYARGIYTDENGNMVYVVYDETGKEIEEIGPIEEGGDFEKSVLMAAKEYNQYVLHYEQQLQSFEDFYGPDVTVEPELLTAEEYEARRGSLVVVDENNTPWNGDAATHNLRDSTRSVLVLPESLLYTETTQYLLAQYPVDLTANHEELPDDISSLIIGFDGKILQQRKDRISLRSIFFEDTSKGAGDPARFDSTSFTYRQDATNQNLELVSPIKGIPLFINMGFYGGTTTNDDGRFGLGVLGPPCPMFYYDTPIQLEAQLPYRPFNPSQYGSSVYYLTKQVYFSCNGYGPMMTTYITSTDFVVDVNLLNGEFLFPNIELSSSADNPSLVYDFKEPDANANGDEGSRFEYTTFDKYDFDLDGEYDIAECGKLNDEGAFVQLESGEECGKDHIQGIYLSGHSERPGTCTDTDGDGQVNPEDPQCQPQFTRLIDTKKVSEDIGLVKKMAQEHVQDTDLFIVRQSTGQLVAMRQGLKDDEKAYGPSRNDIQATEDEVKADFRMLMRGPKSHVSRSFQYSSLRSETHGFSQWQQDSNMAPELQQLDDADHLRTGEMLEIWAINRVTGYIGKAELEMTPGQITNGILDTVVPTIEMRPPNLKIWAERVYDIEAGMTKGEQRRYLIGNEGIGEADDTFIQINVEWYDEDGSALPDALSDYGYTGRLAYVSGANSLTEASQAGNARFAIEPGTHVELVRLSGNIDNQHYYVQVNAVPEGEFDDFGLAGNSGATQNRSDDATFEEVEHNLYRPERFVPFKTPQFNEELTQIQSQAYLLEKRRRIEAEESVEDMITPQPLHEWFYRPDYQFSVYDLEVDKIETQYKDAFGQTITTDVYELDKPILTSSLDILKFLVDLEGSSQQPLERFDGSQSLVLGIGEQELEVNVSANQTIEFTNFDHLGSLEPDDYLTMRIYSNEDASNLLWQFAFEYLDYYALIDDDVLPSAEDGAVEISADTPEVDLLAHLVGFATRDPENKYEVVMRWEKLGAGALDTTYDSDDEYAIFRNKLTLPTNAGATATITARLTTDGESTSAPLKFRVVAGEAASIALTPLFSTPLYIGGKGSVRYRGVARDQYGNPVQDGTGVSIATDGSVQIIEQPESTVNGEFYFEASGADFAEAAALDIRVGDTNQSVDLEILPVDIEFTGLPSEIPAGSTNTFQVRLSANGSPLDNFDLDIWTDKGRLDKSIYTTDGNGQVEVQLIAPSYQSNVTVKVMAAMQAPSEITVTAIQQIGGAGSPAISEQFATLIGDKDVEEAFNFTRWDNEAFSVNKAVSGSIEVFGTEGESLTVTLGNVFEPNRLVQAAYWMNETSQAIDEVGFSNGILENVGLADDTRLSAGKSFRFSPAWGLSRAKISDATRIQLANSNGFVIDYKPVNYGGSIFNLGSGLVLESLSDGRIRLTANTADGSYSVENSQTLPKNQWAQIAGQFNDGQLVLSINDDTQTIPVSGNLQYSKIELVYNAGQPDEYTEQHDMLLGDGIDGQLNALKWFKLNSPALVTFDGGAETASIVIDATGSELLPIHSTGNMLSFGSKLSMQNVAVVAGTTKQQVHLMSSDTFDNFAQAAISSGAVAGLPDFNLAALDEPTQQINLAQNPALNFLNSDAVFPAAQAYDVSFWDVVEIAASLIGLDSLQVIWDQMGNLIAGRDVDIVSLSVAILDVLSLFPPAAPLKVVTGPAKLAIKLLKLGNNKAVKYMGGVLKKMFQQAKKRDFSIVYDGIAFFIVMADMYNDPEAKEGIEILSKMINSTDDFFDILSFFSLSDDEIELPETTDADYYASNVFLIDNLFPVATAKVKPGWAVKLGKGLKEIRPLLDDLPVGSAAKVLGQVGKAIKNMPPEKRARYIKHLTSKGFLKGIMASAKRGLSPKQVAKLLKGFNGQRIPPYALLAIIAYLETEVAEGRLFGDGEVADGTTRAQNIAYLQTTILNASFNFISHGKGKSNPARAANGAAFQLMHLALLQTLSEATGDKVVGIEVPRDVVLFTSPSSFETKNPQAGALIFGRDVDIMLQNSQGEVWVETKSWQSRKNGTVPTDKPYTFKPWGWRTGAREDTDTAEKISLEGSLSHKQFTLDRVAGNIGAIRRGDISATTLDVEVADYRWQYHSFKTKSKAKGQVGQLIAQSPSLSLLRKEFEKKPTNVSDAVLKAHTGAVNAPTGKVDMGALGALLAVIQGELKEAIEEEKADLGYE